MERPCDRRLGQGRAGSSVAGVSQREACEELGGDGTRPRGPCGPEEGLWLSL